MTFLLKNLFFREKENSLVDFLQQFFKMHLCTSTTEGDEEQDYTNIDSSINSLHLYRKLGHKFSLQNLSSHIFVI